MKSVKFIVSATIIGTVVCGILLAVLILVQPEEEFSKDVQVVDRWILPTMLNEVSGIAWVDDQQIACVQDEDGIIFIYDLKEKKVESQILFADSGDYEGIAVHENVAYVLRSDGIIFEVQDYLDPETIEVRYSETDFSGYSNLETLTLNTDRTQLIISNKDKDPKKDAKSFYEIDRISKIRNQNPILQVNKKDPLLRLDDDRYFAVKPSDMAIHPHTGEYYILDGSEPKLIIATADGSLSKVFLLDTRFFPQPEGITFSPNGDLFISNEANNSYATIVKVEIKE